MQYGSEGMITRITKRNINTRCRRRQNEQTSICTLGSLSPSNVHKATDKMHSIMYITHIHSIISFNEHWFKSCSSNYTLVHHWDIKFTWNSTLVQLYFVYHPRSHKNAFSDSKTKCEGKTCYVQQTFCTPKWGNIVLKYENSRV